jgi:hypothetical protein
VRLSDDLFGETAYRFWFLLAGDEPRLCIERAGQTWDLDDTSYGPLHAAITIGAADVLVAERVRILTEALRPA